MPDDRSLAILVSLRNIIVRNGNNVQRRSMCVFIDKLTHGIYVLDVDTVRELDHMTNQLYMADGDIAATNNLLAKLKGLLNA